MHLADNTFGGERSPDSEYANANKPRRESTGLVVF
jgi:hypothetical protein